MNSAEARSVLEKETFINDVDLSGLSLTGLTLADRHFGTVSLRGADLTGSRFSNCHFTETDFSSAKLNGAVFRASGLSNCRFNGVDGRNLSMAACSLKILRFHRCRPFRR